MYIQLFPMILFFQKIRKSKKQKFCWSMMKKTLLQQWFLQRSTRVILLSKDSFAYSACKLKAILYKIISRKWSPYIKNFSKELLGQSSLLMKLVKEGLRRRRTTKYFVYTLLKVLENNHIS